MKIYLKRNPNLIPVVIYDDCDIEKMRIFEENRNKSGIYCFINKKNDKIYIGSSINLTNRFYKYYSLIHLTGNNRPISNALLKYVYSNFSLAILEYTTEKENLLNREQYYLDLLNPDYNILDKAGSTLNFKHSEETLKFFREKRVLSDEARKNLSIASTGKILSEETRGIISSKRKGIKLSTETREKISIQATELRGVKVNIRNVETNEDFYFDTLSKAAKHIGVSRTAIAKALKNNTLIKNVFKVSKAE